MSPDVGVSPSSKSYYKNVNEGLELTLTVTNNATATYSINGGTATPFTNGTKITIGKGDAFDTKTTVTVYASNEDGSAGPATYTYTKKDPSTGLIRVKAEATQFASAPYAYIYNDDSKNVVELTGAWPGAKMTLEDGYYVIEVMKTDAMDEPSAKIIFNGGSGSWQLPSGTDAPGFDVIGSMIYENGTWITEGDIDPTSITLDKTNDIVEIGSSITLTPSILPSNAVKTVTWTSSNPSVATVVNGVVTGKAVGTAKITATTSNNLTATATITVSKQVVRGTVTVNYVDENGNVLKSVSTTGAQDTEYTTSDVEISGYTLKTAPQNVYGTYTSGTTTVTYVYSKVENGGGTVTSDRIYFESNAATVTAYMYSDAGNNGWPGTAMTKESTGLYGIAVPEAYENGNVIFVADGVQVPGAGQAGFQIIKGIVYNNGGVAYVYGQSEQVGGSRTFYFTKPANWKSTVYAYVYDADGTGGSMATWPGTAMTKEDSEYTLTVDVTGYTSPVVIFNDAATQVPASGQRGFNLIDNGHYGSTGMNSIDGLVKGIRIDSFTTNTVNPVEADTKVTLTAVASGAEDLSYQFYYDIDGKETTLGNYNSSATASFTPKAGVYTVGVRVKDGEGNITNEGKLLVVRGSILSEELKITSFKTSPASTQKSGSKVQLTASAAGGVGNYKYKFLVRDEQGNWYKLRDFADSSTYTWTTGSAGKKTLYVDVQDEAGTVVRSQLSYTVTKQEELKITSFGVVGGETQVTVNTKLTLKAEATGGSGSYTYKFLIYNPSTKEWYKLRDFGTSNTQEWKATAEGRKQNTVCRCTGQYRRDSTRPAGSNGHRFTAADRQLQKQ